MKNRLASLLAFALTVSAAPAQSYFVAGDFNGWAPNGTAMTETTPGSGVWTAAVSGLGASQFHAFKVTDGAWDGSEFPQTGNSWLYSDASGNVTVTYNLNTVSDGWVNNTKRIGVSTDPATWTAVGDWQSWNNADPTTAMTPTGGGIYTFQRVLAAGSYQYKAVMSGSWNAIGSDARGVNANNLGFTTTASDPLATFYVNALAGTIKVDVSAVPEPATASLLGLAGALLLLRRMRRN